MMKTQLNLEDEVRESVGDFNKFFEKVKECTEDLIQIDTWREFFEKKYPKMLGNSSENEVKMNVDIDTTMETESRPIVDKEEKLRKVEERLLSKRTNERFANYDGVMSDDSLSLSQKIIHLGKAIDDATRRKIHYASLQGELFEKCFLQSKKVYKETLEETKFSRWWVLFLRKLYKLALEYNQIIYCTVPLSYIRSNFKIIEEICECNKDRWK